MHSSGQHRRSKLEKYAGVVRSTCADRAVRLGECATFFFLFFLTHMGALASTTMRRSACMGAPERVGTPERKCIPVHAGMRVCAPTRAQATGAPMHTRVRPSARRHTCGCAYRRMRVCLCAYRRVQLHICVPAQARAWVHPCTYFFSLAH